MERKCNRKHKNTTNIPRQGRKGENKENERRG
jgi:hypothetical protein